MTEREPEVPTEDALEQEQPADAAEEDDEPVVDVPAEADPADRVEQSRVVSTGDDDYR